SFIVAYSIRQDTWNRLPDDVKAAMDAASEAIEPQICKQVDDSQTATQHKLEEGGTVYNTLSDPVLKDLQAKLQGVGKVWAGELDQRGKPGTPALAEFEQLVHAQGAE
ncbi:MAG TPA: hypothetical protein VGC69_17845, partial [Bordetella sp.]